MKPEKKKKAVNFPNRIVLRVSEIEHINLKKYAEKHNTTISKMLRDFIKEKTNGL